MMNSYKGYKIKGTLSGKPVPIDIIDGKISARDFFDKYISRRKPVIVKGQSIIDFNQLNNIEYMKKKAGHAELLIERRVDGASFGVGITKPMTFDKFLSECVENKDSSLYLTSQPLDILSDGFPEVLSKPLNLIPDDIPLRPALAGNLVPQQINLWMGNTKEGTSTGLHHDFHDNFYILLRGTKRFTVYSPNEAHKMYTVGKVEKVFENGLITYEYGPLKYPDGSDDDGRRKIKQLELLNKISDAESNIKILTELSVDSDALCKAEEILKNLEHEWDEEMSKLIEDEEDDDYYDSEDKETSKDTPPSFSNINFFGSIDTPDRKKFPLFSSASPAVAEIHAGDMFYLPTGWFHEVRSFNSVENNGHMALNYWFHPPSSDNYESPYGKDAVWERLWEVRGLNKMNKKRKAIDDNIEPSEKKCKNA